MVEGLLLRGGVRVSCVNYFSQAKSLSEGFAATGLHLDFLSLCTGAGAVLELALRRPMAPSVQLLPKGGGKG